MKSIRNLGFLAVLGVFLAAQSGYAFEECSPGECTCDGDFQVSIEFSLGCSSQFCENATGYCEVACEECYDRDNQGEPDCDGEECTITCTCDPNG